MFVMKELQQSKLCAMKYCFSKVKLKGFLELRETTFWPFIERRKKQVTKVCRARIQLGLKTPLGLEFKWPNYQRATIQLVGLNMYPRLSMSFYHT